MDKYLCLTGHGFISTRKLIQWSLVTEPHMQQRMGPESHRKEQVSSSMSDEYISSLAARTQVLHVILRKHQKTMCPQLFGHRITTTITFVPSRICEGGMRLIGYTASDVWMWVPCVQFVFELCWRDFPFLFVSYHNDWWRWTFLYKLSYIIFIPNCQWSLLYI